jgi:uncharacterized protein
MSDFEPEAIALKLFRRLREDRFNVGMDEYLAAIEAILWEDGPQNLDSLKSVLKLLWCHSCEAQSQFDPLWDEVTASGSRSTPKTPREPANLVKPDPGSSDREESESLELPEPKTPQVQPPTTLLPSTEAGFTPYPLRTTLMLDEVEGSPLLQTYFPVNRRSMSYLWRYLRRPIADGAPNVLDIAATIEQTTRQGFFLAPVYRRCEVNYARLVLLIDQDGSMTPFHRFTRDLVETAKEGSWLQPENVEVYYFHNVPADFVYTDPYRTKPIPLERSLVSWDSETSVLVVSDAGAARGYRRRDRIRITTEFLMQIQQRTHLVSWLNPMPKERWESTSAAVISHLVRMEPLSDDGMGNAIDIVRGQPLSH